MAKFVIKTNIKTCNDDSSFTGIAYVRGIHRPSSTVLFSSINLAMKFPSKKVAEEYIKRYNNSLNCMPDTATVEQLI